MDTRLRESQGAFRLEKQRIVASSAEYTRTALVADEEYLGKLKKLIRAGLTSSTNPQSEGTSKGSKPESFQREMQVLPLEVLSLAQHSYIMAWTSFQDDLDTLMMHLSRKPRFAQPLFGKFYKPKQA